MGTQAAQRLGAGQVRHIDIEYDQVEGAAGQKVQTFLAIGSLVTLKIRGAKEGRTQAADLQFVIDDEHGYTVQIDVEESPQGRRVWRAKAVAAFLSNFLPAVRKRNREGGAPAFAFTIHGHMTTV